MSRFKRMKNKAQKVKDAEGIFNMPSGIIVQGGGGSQEWRTRVREIVTPVYFDTHGTHFFDADGKMIAQIRGWGGLTSSGLPDLEAIEIQTQWGVMIATAINEHLARLKTESDGGAVTQTTQTST